MKNRKGIALILALMMTFVGAYSVTAFADDVTIKWPTSKSYQYNGSTQKIEPTITPEYYNNYNITYYEYDEHEGYKWISDPKDVGHYRAVVSVGSGDTVSGQREWDYYITPAPLTIKAVAKTGDKAVTYGQVAGKFELDSSALDLKGSDTPSVIEGEKVFTTNYSVGDEAGGNYIITPEIDTFSAKNYSLTGASVDLDVKPTKLNIEWFDKNNNKIDNNKSYVYNGQTQGVYAKIDNEGVYSADIGNVVIEYTTDPMSVNEKKDAGSYEAKVKLKGSCIPRVLNSYELQNETLDWTIDKCPVYYKYDKAELEVEFDGDYHGLTGQFYGVVEGEALEPVYDQNGNSFVHVNDYTVGIEDFNAKEGTTTYKNNYIFYTDESFKTEVSDTNKIQGTVTITKMPLAITWPTKKTYDWTGKEVEYAPITIGPEEGKEIKGEKINFVPTVVGNKGTAVGNYEATVNAYSVKDTDTEREATTSDFELILPETDAWKIVSTPTSGGESEPELDPAVTDLVNMINALNPASATYPADAQAVVDAYNALTPKQQEDGRLREQTVATKLADAFAEVQAEADKRAAQPVIDQINALDDNSTKEEVEAARTAYEALTPAQQAACGSAIITLQGQEYRIYSTEAKAKKVKNFKVKNLKGKRAKATWKKTANIDGYQITYKAKGVKVKKVTAKASATKRIFKKLKKGKTYTFKIRSFNKVYNPITGEEENVYGKWTTKKVTIKK